MSAYSPVTAKESPAGGFLPTDRFEIDQYVRVFLPNGRTDIGKVASFREDTIVVTSLHGYDLAVSPRFVKRAFLLVLDLNGVLIARGKGCFVHRPYVKEFLKFVFTNFVVAVWTSGLERSSDPIIESVFEGYEDRLLFRLYRSSCKPLPTQQNPWGTIKDLQLIFSRFPKSFHSVNTIIIDDSPDKCSHPDIALCPVPFKDAQLQRDDDGLKKAISVLEEVLAVESHAPVIRAAEERLAAIRAGEHGVVEAAQLKMLEDRAALPTEVCPPSTQHNDGATPLTEVDLWKSRLCCDHLRGHCSYGSECRYSHGEDDGHRPCSRKGKCQYGHADRWTCSDANAAEHAHPKDNRDLRQSASDKPNVSTPFEDVRSEEKSKERTAQGAEKHRTMRSVTATATTTTTVTSNSNSSGYPLHVVGTPDLVFSTNPYHNRLFEGGNRYMAHMTPSPLSSQTPGQQLQGPRQLPLQLVQYEQHPAAIGVPAPRRDARDSHREVASGVPWQSVCGNNVPPPPPPPPPQQQQTWFDPQRPQRYDGAEQRRTDGAIHLMGNSSDGASLIRQLQSLELLKRKQST